MFLTAAFYRFVVLDDTEHLRPQLLAQCQVHQVKGNVLLGRALGTGGGAIDIEGALTVGANEVSNTTIQQGGMRVSTTNLTQDQSYLPSANCTPATPPQAISIKWSRYL